LKKIGEWKANNQKQMEKVLNGGIKPEGRGGEEVDTITGQEPNINSVAGLRERMRDWENEVGRALTL